MSTYFFGHQSRDPPYTENDNHEEPKYFEDPPPPTSWLPDFEDPFDSYIARPLSSDNIGTINPALIPSHGQSTYSRAFVPNRNTFIEEPRPQISPAVLEKLAVSPSPEVKWYSGGREISGGKKPPRLRLSRDHSTEPETKDSTAAPVRYEVNVQTGLDEIKRIKLVFRGDTSTSASNSRPSSSGNMMRNARRMTPPAAMGDDWRLLPHVSELHLDENTPPPEVRKRMRDENVMVVIPRKRINKALYPVFLASDARQKMVRNKTTGKINIKYEW